MEVHNETEELLNSILPEEKLKEEKQWLKKTTDLEEIVYEGFVDKEDETEVKIPVRDFDIALLAFITASRESRQMARLCSEIGIVQFFNTGDLSQCQRFLDAIPKNYGRRAAYVKWLTAFVPVRMNMETKKLKKDKRDEAIPFSTENIKKALEMPFWEFSPAIQPDVEYTAESVMSAVRSVLAKHRTERYKNKDDAAKKRLDDIEAAISTVH